MTRTDRETVRKIQKCPDAFLCSDVDGELIIVHGQTGGFFSLKQVGYQIWRALGTLKSARLISSNETIAHLSLARLVIDVGLVQDLSAQNLNSLFLCTQPAHLQKLFGNDFSATERDSKRAEFLREKLKDIKLV